MTIRRERALAGNWEKRCGGDCLKTNSGGGLVADKPLGLILSRGCEALEGWPRLPEDTAKPPLQAGLSTQFL